MRAYFFGNMYLSSIQQGIQAAHVTAELFMKAHSEDGNTALIEWASNHKTMILLNAGYSHTIRGLVGFFEDKQNPYPWASFCEGLDALDGAMTCVGIVLPEKIYTLSSWMNETIVASKDPINWKVSQIINYKEIYVNPSAPDSLVQSHSGGGYVEWTYSDWEIELASRIGKFGLAR